MLYCEALGDAHALWLNVMRILRKEEVTDMSAGSPE